MIIQGKCFIDWLDCWNAVRGYKLSPDEVCDIVHEVQIAGEQEQHQAEVYRKQMVAAESENERLRKFLAIHAVNVDWGKSRCQICGESAERESQIKHADNCPLKT